MRYIFEKLTFFENSFDKNQSEEKSNFFRIHTIKGMYFVIFGYILNNKWITPFAIVKVLLSSITSYKRRNSLPRKRSISIGRISLPCLPLISPTHLPAVAKLTNAGRVDSFLPFHFYSISNAVLRRIQTLFITLLRPFKMCLGMPPLVAPFENTTDFLWISISYSLM